MRSIVFLLLFISVILTSCTKTMDLPAQPMNRILSYKVTNVYNGSISGVVNDTEKSITIYIPFYYNLGVIDPEITVSQGAKLQNEVLPVPFDDSTTTYTVIGADGSTATYKLTIVIQQPGFVVNEHSTETTVKAYNIRGGISISGNFNTKDLSVIKPSLVSIATGKEFPIAVEALTVIEGIHNTATGEASYTLSNATIPATMDTGIFKLKVKIFNKTAETQYPIRINYPPNGMLFLYNKTFTQGEVFTITAAATSIFRNLKSFEIKVNGQYVNLPIQSYTVYEAKVKLPDDFPPGNYTETRLRFEDTSEIVIAYNTITVHAK